MLSQKRMNQILLQIENKVDKSKLNELYNVIEHVEYQDYNSWNDKSFRIYDRPKIMTGTNYSIIFDNISLKDAKNISALIYNLTEEIPNINLRRKHDK